MLARAVAVKLGEELGQTIVVENKPGAAATIGTAQVARAVPDGKTLLLGDIATHAINPIALPNLPYDPDRDFIPVSRLTSVSLALVANPALGIKDFQGFVTRVKAEPGRHSYASGGAGTPSHLAMEMLQSLTGTQMLHVPYKGSSPGLTDVMSGHVDFMIDGAAAPIVKAGRLTALAVTGDRSQAFPAVPTIADSGVPQYRFTSWHGVFVPKGTDPAIVDRLSKAIVKVTAEPDLKAHFAELGINIVGSTPQEFADFIREQRLQLTALVKARNITFDQ
ncbi:tripartite tricarboxylate transporter substrate binding protein [Comamonadaceae bacterium PP-2]